MANVAADGGVARAAGLNPKWLLFSGRTDHTYTHRAPSGVVKLWLWGGSDRPGSPDATGCGPGTLYRVRLDNGDRLRIRVGGRSTAGGGGSVDGGWEDWLLGRLVRGGYPDGGDGVRQELTVRWGYAYPGTGPVWTRSLFWRCNGAGGATRVWLTPLDGEERLIIVEPGAGASPSPRYRWGGGSPMDAYPEGAWGVGDFPFDRETWSPPSPFDEDQSLAWPPEDSGQGPPNFSYDYGWCGNVGGGGPFDEFPDPDPPEAWFGWEQDMTDYRVGLFGTSIEQPSWPVSDLGAFTWADDTPGGDNFHDDIGPGDPMPDPPGPGDQPRRPRDEVPPKVLSYDISPPSNEERETRFGETGWEEHGGNGEPSAFGPRCPGGGGWGGGAAGNTTRRQVVSGDWVSWIRMGQGTGKAGGRWWNTSVVETVIAGDGTVRWGTAGSWLFETLPYWVPGYPSAPSDPAPEGLDYAWPETDAYEYVVEDGDEWGHWEPADGDLLVPYPYLHEPAYDGYLGMGAAWVCPEEPEAAKRARWRVGHVGWGRNNGW